MPRPGTRPKPACPRCKSKRIMPNLDGSKRCARCGQRIARDGRLLPSADHRGDKAETQKQLILL